MPHDATHGHHAGRREAGFTIAELVIGLAIFVILAAVLVDHLVVNYRGTQEDRDRVFAYGKAQAILAEIQGHVDRGAIGQAVDLDSLDDGVVNKPNLTIQRDATGSLLLPDHALSGNMQRGGNWLWSRRITVQPFQGLDNRNVRYVTVRIFRRDAAGNDRAIADLSSVINSAGSAFPTTQVFDVYLLAVENIPGWWVYMDSIRPFVESTITDLESRNPGLEVRTHWITKASYGRNQAYRPYINDAQDSLQDIPAVYFYPGRMPAGSASTFYYVPDNMRARVNRDGFDTNGYDALQNPLPYALADYWNHAMRHPDEQAFHDSRLAAIATREAEIAAARAAGTAPPPPLIDMAKEPTLRLLLEDLNTNPLKYRNALIINLHGELMPMPALRNFADPAKLPETFPEVRVVTHPEELRTRRDPVAIDPVRLRVHAFTTNAQTWTGPDTLGAPIVVEVMGMNLVDPAAGGRPVLHPTVQIESLRGGSLVNGTRDYFPFAPAVWESSPPSNPSPPLAGQMHYRAEFVDPGAGQEKFTRIYLSNTPVVAPPIGGRGLVANERARLYGMAYVPGCTEAARDFSRDLYTSGLGPKNTARWRITIPGTAFADQLFVNAAGNRYTPTTDVLLRVRTRIWSGPSPAGSGTFWPPAQRNQPDNLSVTYTWWADNFTDVPFTERSQFLGDPRHVPYKDLLRADPDFADGYNCFHDALTNGGENSAADYPALDGARLRNNWRGRMSADVPRYFELLRKGLAASRCVYTTLTGFSYYYLGYGNEIGYDAANGYPNSIPCNLRPMGSPGTNGFINNITGTRALVRGAGAVYWVGLPWLGELCPDSHYASQWLAADASGNPRGNLDAGTGATQFRQTPVAPAYGGSNRTAFGTAMSSFGHRTQEEGCTTLFNIGTAASTFHHQYSTGTGTLTGAGPEIAANYNFNMPGTAQISRPFALATNGAGSVGDEWNFTPYSAERFTASMLRTYYNHPNGNTGSGLVRLVDTGNRNAAYVVVSGIDKTVDTGSAFLARFALLSLVHSYFEAGATGPLRIEQPPRLEVVAPTEITELIQPTTIPIRYEVSWRRWDGRPYTQTGTVTEPESQLDYVLMYSNDGGTTWRHVQDDSPATPGARPSDPAHIRPDAGAGQETFDWDVPATSFPEGSYLLWVECYRRGASIHYSHHKVKFFIQR